MPRHNRVRPDGTLIAVPDRGLSWGNRGVRHDPAGRLVRCSRGRTWASCLLEDKGIRRQQWAPGPEIDRRRHAGRLARPGPAPERDRGGRGRYAPNQPGTSRRNAWPAAMARRSASRADIRSGPSTPAHRERMSSKIIADVASASRPRGVM
jgi:hypothetical protein